MRFLVRKRAFSQTAAVLGLMALAACSGDFSQDPEDRAPRPEGRNDFVDEDNSVFGEGGLNLRRVLNGDLLRGENGQTGGSLPVNKYLWQASLDTLSFMPLGSTDPFSGVIATDWSATADAPGERFKVTVLVSSAVLSATSLKVAVYRQQRGGDGNWIQTAVDPNTPRQIEDAILTRARQIRVAEIETSNTG